MKINKKWLIISFSLFITGLLFGSYTTLLFQPSQETIAYWRNSNGNLYCYVRGNLMSYEHALRDALFDLNESGGTVYSDPNDNNIYHMK